MRCFVLPFALVSSLFATELVHEDFSGPGLPKGWSTGGRPNSWSVVEKVWIDDVLVGTQ